MACSVHPEHLSCLACNLDTLGLSISSFVLLMIASDEWGHSILVRGHLLCRWRFSLGQTKGKERKTTHNWTASRGRNRKEQHKTRRREQWFCSCSLYFQLNDEQEPTLLSACCSWCSSWRSKVSTSHLSSLHHFHLLILMLLPRPLYCNLVFVHKQCSARTYKHTYTYTRTNTHGLGGFTWSQRDTSLLVRMGFPTQHPPPLPSPSLPSFPSPSLDVLGFLLGEG